MNEVLTDDVPQPGGVRSMPKAAVNQWIIGETAKVREEVDAALESYRFNDAAKALYAFVWGKVCDWYVELQAAVCRLRGCRGDGRDPRRPCAG